MNFANITCLFGTMSSIVLIVCYLIWDTRHEKTIQILKDCEDVNDTILIELSLQVRWFKYLSFMAGCIVFPLGLCGLYCIVELITNH